MTDINNWSELVQVVKFRSRNFNGKYNEPPYFSDYTLIPVDEYQLSNLLGCVISSQPTGDWWQELVSIVTVAMQKSGLKELRTNGAAFTIDDLRTKSYNELKEMMK